MNTSSEVTLQFGDSGEKGHLFKLDIKRIEELQRNCGAGIGEIGRRVMGGQFHIKDIYETIRLGLIGGGIPPTEAKTIVDQYVDGCVLAREGDPSAPLTVANVILMAVFYGLDEVPEAADAPGEPEAGTDI
ncbi:gene transfer agent family protein [Euryhalocaulis caribicus]|uniref:gene transfer agent family protein n=1 Tax=Euryhalocaulis caribicus TaxID=1161401 RepID=UPI0003A51327|nr:gene transfer agent family protein [Euryhalocaulis caribicus]